MMIFPKNARVGRNVQKVTQPPVGITQQAVSQCTKASAPEQKISYNVAQGRLYLLLEIF
jgi:hypothetical protein